MGEGELSSIYSRVKGECFLGNFSVAGIPEPFPFVCRKVRVFLLREGSVLFGVKSLSPVSLGVV